MSTGALFHWKRNIEEDVRVVMQAEGATDVSAAARKTWARKFIQDQVPWWVAGQPLRAHEEQMIGAAFEARFHAAKGRKRIRRGRKDENDI